VVHHAKFFKALGERVKELRQKRGYSQEDMIAFGFSARHWQQIEAGRPITMTTLLRICDAFKVPIAVVVRGTDKAIYRDSRRLESLS
jgi:transcriptional regulator with XRE-family HTH domain